MTAFQKSERPVDVAKCLGSSVIMELKWFFETSHHSSPSRHRGRESSDALTSVALAVDPTAGSRARKDEPGNTAMHLLVEKHQCPSYARGGSEATVGYGPSTSM